MQTCEIHSTDGMMIKTVSRVAMLELPDGKYPIVDGTIVADRVTYYLNEGKPHQFVFSIAPSKPSKISRVESADRLSYILYAKYTDAAKQAALTLVVTNG